MRGFGNSNRVATVLRPPVHGEDRAGCALVDTDSSRHLKTLGCGLAAARRHRYAVLLGRDAYTTLIRKRALHGPMRSEYVDDSLVGRIDCLDPRGPR